MPLQVNLPPTSIKPFKEFLNRAFMLLALEILQQFEGSNTVVIGAEITEEQRDTGCDYVIEPGAMTNEPADGHYTVSQINGDCEQLPA